MIDISYLDQGRAMSEQDFIKIAAGSTFALVNVVSVNDSEWAIFGPYGVYASSAGSRTFDLATAHTLLAKWGIKRFFQGGDLKELP